jgi:hypothetical protein
MAQGMRVFTVRLEDDLVERLERVVGKGERGAFIRVVIEAAVRAREASKGDTSRVERGGYVRGVASFLREAAMAFDVIDVFLASAVANGGTFTVGYPAGRTAGSYVGGFRHSVVSTLLGSLRAERSQISVSFGAASATVTNSSGLVIPAGTQVMVQFDRPGEDSFDAGGLMVSDKLAAMGLVMVNLGSPAASAANSVVLSQNCTAATGLATGINGATASGGVATLDVPRALVAAWTNTAVVTITGTDEYGRVIRQSSASGTSLTGTKAFRTVTGVSTSADITGLTVGTGKVLGLPVFLPGAGHVIRELQDGAVATAGTVVPGVRATATATTGDVRGTYAPNGTPDGVIAFQLLLALDDASYLGVPQF